MLTYLLTRVYLTNGIRGLSLAVGLYKTRDTARAYAAVGLGEFCTANPEYHPLLDGFTATNEKSGEKVIWEIQQMRLT